MGRHGRAQRQVPPAEARGARGAPARSITSAGGLRGLHTCLRGSDRPAVAPRVLPRGRRPRHPAPAGGRRVRGRPLRAARADRLQPALRVPPRGLHPHRAEVPEAAARGARRRTRTRTSSDGRSATCCWPACSSAGPMPPRPTSSSPWPNRRRARSPARSGSTTTSSGTPRTSWPGSPPRTWRRPTCAARPSGRCPGSTSRT